jgi:NifU-like protein involved in Fe-S cluster formation
VYDDAFLDHFTNPRRQGSLDDATHRGVAEETACGDRVWLDLRVEEGVIRDARFRAQGCVGAIAVASAMADLLPGRPATADAVRPAEIERLLGAIPRAKRHALRLAREALADAIAKSAGPTSPAAG